MFLYFFGENMLFLLAHEYIVGPLNRGGVSAKNKVSPKLTILWYCQATKHQRYNNKNFSEETNNFVDEVINLSW